MQNRRHFVLSAASAAYLMDPPMPQSQVFELRNYTLHPGQRDALIQLFEREFIEPQEALGARVIGTFRDLDRPDHFVWLRGFADMPSRAAALNAFYTGPVWQAHRGAANATIIDSDNVLLLRQIGGDLPGEASVRPAVGTRELPESVFVATTYSVAPSDESSFADAFARHVAPCWRDAGAQIVATFATERTENNFPRLPVREGETVFVAMARFASAAAYEAHRAELSASPLWIEQIEPLLRGSLTAPTQTLRMQPTARSLMA